MAAVRPGSGQVSVLELALERRDWSLARCRYDEPGGARRLLQSSRDGAVQRRREEGAGIDALAREFGVSRRSVFRILARGRAA